MDEDLKLKVYNTETRTKEEITPLDGKMVRMYTCGPTVYDFAHIGNFRTYVFEDLLRRTIKFFGMKVFQVMNLTDVDDKTIKGAIAKKISLDDYTKPYIEAFFEDLNALNIEPAEAYPAATDYIQEMIIIIQRLLADGVAYHGTDGSVYFDIDRFPSYGRLSHLQLSELKCGASQRVAADEYDKDHVCDFVLWKMYDTDRDGNIFWDSPFGPGRPGWHIECSAMAMQLLGETIDIHVGGVDNMFPHHENEIAQSEAFSSKRFVTHWMHAEHLLVDHKKMSKSLGNFYTLRDLLNRGYSGKAVRYMLLHAHYRTQLNFTFPGLDGAASAITRLSDFVLRLRALRGPAREEQSLGTLLRKTHTAFKAALADDLNISQALASLFDLVREVNVLCDAHQVSEEEADKVLELLAHFDTVLGVIPLESEELEVPLDLEEALTKRNKARAEKQWKVADEWRDVITARGYMIEDTPSGSRLKKV
jgi:cysteinyl-tRNA synthetase